MCHKGLFVWLGFDIRDTPTSLGFCGGFVIHVGGMRLHEWIFGRFFGGLCRRGSEGAGVLIGSRSAQDSCATFTYGFITGYSSLDFSVL